eukprot:4336134-Pyramimonas_sp.AAC.1
MLFDHSMLEDVLSEIVIFGNAQGTLGAILRSVLGSQFFLVKHFNKDVETMLGTCYFFEDVPGEIQMFR